MEGPEKAQREVQRLFLQHTAPLRGFILGLLPDRVAADDIFQDVFLTALKRAEDFDVSRNFLSWVRGIARLKVLEHHRKRGALPQLFDRDLMELLACEGERRRDPWEERRAALARCIGQLAPRARQILELRYAEQPLSAALIAERLGWTAAAVDVALSRARRFLQDCTRRSLQPGGAS